MKFIVVFPIRFPSLEDSPLVQFLPRNTVLPIFLCTSPLFARVFLIRSFVERSVTFIFVFEPSFCECDAVFTNFHLWFETCNFAGCAHAEWGPRGLANGVYPSCWMHLHGTSITSHRPREPHWYLACELQLIPSLHYYSIQIAKIKLV